MLVKKGKEIPPLDAMIACVVKTNDEKLITKDEHDS
jgi:predicted nucleic acid-binding protein